ncbi:unnamed protein product [Gongylonema pulchrum]|uniref:DOCKER domain-containing protein n=1 Tax=Gongylonema pulchrum TaxID=637853 RepID=A0A183E3R9_9BILA|nr:unnamed protein product [Gongylonema pulchrum]
MDEVALQENVAYVQMTHVEPYKNGYDVLSYEAHTNLRQFVYEMSVMDEKVPQDEPKLARQALKRIFVTVEDSFPNTRRRSRVVKRSETRLVSVCAEALEANEAAIGDDQIEYHNMLKNAFAAMIERLHGYFGEMMPVEQDHADSVPAVSQEQRTNRNSMHILDSIGGINS